MTTVDPSGTLPVTTSLAASGPAAVPVAGSSVTPIAGLKNLAYALARALCATPRQVSSGLSVAQVLPALPGALLGVPLGIGLSLPRTALGS